MALLRDEGGEDFLRRGAYPKAGERACEAMLRYLKAQSQLEAAAEERRAAGDRETYNRYPHSLISAYDLDHALSTNPMEFSELGRLNWSHERPRIDVDISTRERRGSTLSIVVQPADETLKWESVDVGMWGRSMIRHVSTDFQQFNSGLMGMDLGRVRVMEISVEGEVLHDFYRLDQKRGGLTAERLAAAREAVFHAAQHKLSQLSMHFNCRMTSRLVMYGPLRTLEIRQGTPNETLSGGMHSGDQAAPRTTSVLDASGWSGELIQGFIAKHPYCASWLSGFVEKRRGSRSTEVLRQELADYMEVPRHLVGEDVMTALMAATDGSSFADEAMRRLKSAEVLQAFIAESGRKGSWIDRAASMTRREKYSLLNWLLTAHSKVMCKDGVESLEPAEVFRAAVEMDAPWRAEKTAMPAKARTTLDRMLVIAAICCVPEHNRFGAVDGQKALSKATQHLLARLAMQSDWDGLIRWAQGSWPRLAKELEKLKIEAPVAVRAKDDDPTSSKKSGKTKR